MKKSFFLLLLSVLFLFSSCSKSNEQEKQNYSDIKANYQNEIKQLLDGSYERISFNDCHFSELPDADEIYELKTEKRVVSALETKEYFEKIIKEYGLEGTYSFERDVYDCKYFDEEAEPIKYKKAVDTMNSGENNGAGFSLENNENIYVLMGHAGVYEYDNGKSTKYLKEISDGKIKPKSSAVGLISDYGIVFKEYEEENLESEDSYETYDGKLSIKEVKELTEKYFSEKCDPFPVADNLKEKVIRITVLKFEDEKYGFCINTKRLYRDIEIYYSFTGGISPGTDHVPDSDRKESYVLDKDGVCTYVGFNISSPFVETENVYDKMIGLNDAVAVIVKKFGEKTKFKFRNVKLAYTGYNIMSEVNNPDTEKDEESKYKEYRLYWIFEGINKTNAKQIDIFVDAVNEEIMYVTHD